MFRSWLPIILLGIIKPIYFFQNDVIKIAFFFLFKNGIKRIFVKNDLK